MMTIFNYFKIKILQYYIISCGIHVNEFRDHMITANINTHAYNMHYKYSEVLIIKLGIMDTSNYILQ